MISLKKNKDFGRTIFPKKPQGSLQGDRVSTSSPSPSFVFEFFQGFALTPRWFVLVAVLTAVGCSTLPQGYHPSNPIKPEEFSHALFDQSLREHVKDGFVNYPGYQSDSRLTQYLTQLNRVNPTTLPSNNDRLALWINAYNAFAIRGILDGYSPKTWTGKYKYFVSRDYLVGGSKINLYSMERDILIAQFREPRIHFAIVCASRSCPKLRSWAYTTDTLEQQLDDSARLFINDPSRNLFDTDKKIAYLSKIFDWFSEDFVSHSGSLTKYVAQYVDDAQLAQDLKNGRYKVKFLEYDWNLNGAPPGQSPSST